MSTKSLSQTDLFQLVKQVPIIEVARCYLGEPIRERWWRCCFHNDKNPSLTIYKEHLKCFGCGWFGDGPALLARLNNLRPLEAARMIASDFGIPLPGASREERAQAREAARLAKARREMETRFKAVEGEVYQHLSSLYRSLGHVLAGIRTEADLERLGGLYHVEPVLEHFLDVLRIGTVKERATILKDERLKLVMFK